MPFPDLSTTHRAQALRIADLMVLVGLAALPAAAVSPPRAPETLALSAVLLSLGGVLWWLPRLARPGRGLDLLVLPLFIVLAFVDLILIGIAFANDARAGILILAAQVGALGYASFRW
jgi:hypothetical protein